MRTFKTAWRLGIAACLSITTPGFVHASPSGSAPIPAELFDELEYRFIGPAGNRVIAVVGVVGDANVYYAGAASGGIFKTTDGGVHWEPIFDQQPAASIGSLAIAASDPNVVWAGTGETFLRANISIGNGIYRSTDAGKSWQHMGLETTGRIGRVIIHPTDPDVVYAAALGHCYGPQPERGVYRTRDGGESWERILFVDERTGASDLVMDPNNPRILFAGTWEIFVNTWSRRSGGPGSGLYTSRDGGESWERLEGRGLPEPPWGKIGLAMSAADSNRIYALIETNSNRDFAPLEEFQGVLWRSEDGGETWEMTSADNSLVQRPLYYSRATVAPDDPDEIHFMSVRHRISLDGGVTSERGDAGYDHHDMWIDPQNPARMIVGHDGGVSISTNRGKSWFRPQLPVAQMYHVHVDDRIPYFVYGNRQDGPSTRGPSNTLTGRQIPIGAWHAVGGCEVGFAVPSPADNNIVWTGCFDGILERYDLRTGHARNVSVWPYYLLSRAAKDLRYRFQWTFPIAISRHDPRRVYVGSQYVHQTVNEGQSWTVISPDLTSDDESKQQRTGGLTLDDAGPTLAPTVFALAESPREAGVIWAGTNDGQVQLTRDGGESWTNVTPNLPELPPWGTVSNLEPSRHAAGRAYLTVDRHQLGDTASYVYRTDDYGRSWRRITTGIPQDVFSYAHCVREDPVRPGLLYLGTENGVYVSFDDGGAWHSLRSNLPHAPVHWLAVQEHFSDLVVATYGRGFWILDDITPLRELPAALGPEPVLFAPRPAYRFREREGPMRQPGDPAAGRNPPYGASLHYYLEAEPEDELELSILDAARVGVRTLEEVATSAGLHRIYWDLEYDDPPEIRLRTKPEENPHVTIPDQGWRPLRDDEDPFTLLAPPGRYTVRLAVGEKILTRELVVLKDPGSAGSEDDIRAQMDLLFGLRDMLEEATGIINEIEWLRKQIDDLDERLEDWPEESVPEVGEIVAAGREVDDRLKAIEGQFFDPRLTGAGQDALRWESRLHSRILHLAWGLGRGDFPPTDQQIEVYDLLKEELRNHRQQFAELREHDVAGFNELLREKGLAYLMTVPAP